LYLRLVPVGHVNEVQDAGGGVVVVHGVDVTNSQHLPSSLAQQVAVAQKIFAAPILRVIPVGHS